MITLSSARTSTAVSWTSSLAMVSSTCELLYSILDFSPRRDPCTCEHQHRSISHRGRYIKRRGYERQRPHLLQGPSGTRDCAGKRRRRPCNRWKAHCRGTSKGVPSVWPVSYVNTGSTGTFTPDSDTAAITDEECLPRNSKTLESQRRPRTNGGEQRGSCRNLFASLRSRQRRYHSNER